jgi:hypothetical protein
MARIAQRLADSGLVLPPSITPPPGVVLPSGSCASSAGAH